MQNYQSQKQISNISQNLKIVQKRMGEAADKAGKSLDEIKLVAVTKLLPIEVIQGGIEAGIRCFGENYPEQAAEKIKKIKSKADLEWHMIGHIQSRKASTVCEYFDMVHSVDRLKIARYLDRYAGEQSKNLPVLIEVNVSGEDSKFGFPAYNHLEWDNLTTQLAQIEELRNISVRGLMTMPPLFDDPEKCRPIYKKLKRLQQYLQEKLPGMAWQELSIGTSFDYPVAIEEGATIVRIGTEIFGQRPH